MLHVVIVRHSPEDCPGRPGNESVIPCMGKMSENLSSQTLRTVGHWVDPPGHVNYLVIEAPSAHAIQEALMASGIVAYAKVEIHPVLSMEG